jgi:triosephosphate isomerase
MTAPSRTRVIAANWKMNKTVAEAIAYLDELLELVDFGALGPTEVAVCPSFTALGPSVQRCGATAVRVFAQNMHEQPRGAFTGEVSAPMLAELGVDGVVLGHSERREHFGETDMALEAKVPAALGAGLTPMLCVGESALERESGETERKLRDQIQADLEAVETERLPDVVIAYEPIWAIGTGVVATPAQAQEAIAFIRSLVSDRSPEAARQVRILYGGSVTPDNAAQLLALPDVDGALVGGASLAADSFAAIVAAARP